MLRNALRPVFSRRRAIQGTPFIERAAASLFPHAAPRCRVKKAKAWFCLREDLIHENSFELTKEFSVRKGETCRALARKVARHTGGGFSPLFLPFRGSRLINGKKIHLHPYAHKGNEAKMRFCLVLRICFEVSEILHSTFYILHLPFKKRSFVAALLRMTGGGGLRSAGVGSPRSS